MISTSVSPTGLPGWDMGHYLTPWWWHIVMWTDPLRTGAVLGGGLLLYACVELWGWGLCAIALFTSALLMVLSLVYRLYLDNRKPRKRFPMPVWEAELAMQARVWAPRVAAAAHWVLRLAMWQDWRATLTLLAFSCLLSIVGSYLSLSSLLLAMWLAAFSLPFLWDAQQVMMHRSASGGSAISPLAYPQRLSPLSSPIRSPTQLPAAPSPLGAMQDVGQMLAMPSPSPDTILYSPADLGTASHLHTRAAEVASAAAAAAAAAAAEPTAAAALPPALSPSPAVAVLRGIASPAEFADAQAHTSSEAGVALPHPESRLMHPHSGVRPFGEGACPITGLVYKGGAVRGLLQPLTPDMRILFAEPVMWSLGGPWSQCIMTVDLDACRFVEPPLGDAFAFPTAGILRVDREGLEEDSHIQLRFSLAPDPAGHPSTCVVQLPVGEGDMLIGICDVLIRQGCIAAGLPPLEGSAPLVTHLPLPEKPPLVSVASLASAPRQTGSAWGVSGTAALPPHAPGGGGADVGGLPPAVCRSMSRQASEPVSAAVFAQLAIANAKLDALDGAVQGSLLAAY